MIKEIKNVRHFINPIEWQSKQWLLKKLDERKIAPKALLLMGPSLHWCPPTPSFINNVRKETRIRT